MKDYTNRYNYAYQNPKFNEDGEMICGKTIYAISSFAAETVKAWARCHPNDMEYFDSGYGEWLARTRCGLKIAKKRVKFAVGKVKEAERELRTAFEKLREARRYLRDAIDEQDALTFELMGQEDNDRW